VYFLLSANAEISGSGENMEARRKFIKDITGVVPTRWVKKYTGSMFIWICCTDDYLNGIYITAHNYEVAAICRTNVISKLDFFVANTCVYRKEYDTDIFWLLKRKNKNIRLLYAKQKIELTNEAILRDTNILRDVGTFGFMTSKSDRLMFKNRDKGFETALYLSFEKVSGLYGV